MKASCMKRVKLLFLNFRASHVPQSCSSDPSRKSSALLDFPNLSQLAWYSEWVPLIMTGEYDKKQPRAISEQNRGAEKGSRSSVLSPYEGKISEKLVPLSILFPCGSPPSWPGARISLNLIKSHLISYYDTQSPRPFGALAGAPKHDRPGYCELRFYFKIELQFLSARYFGSKDSFSFFIWKTTKSGSYGSPWSN